MNIEEKIFKIKQRIWELKEERTKARNKKDFFACSSQITGLEEAIQILEDITITEL